MDYIQRGVQIDDKTIAVQLEFVKFFNDEWFPRLRELADMPDAKDYVLQDVTNYLYWAVWSDLDLKFELTDKDKDYINVLMNTSKYHSRFASDELW